MATIYQGRRVSAADAFLKPAMKRPNLHVVTHTFAQRLIFAGDRAVGVVVRKNGHISEGAGTARGDRVARQPGLTAVVAAVRDWSA